MHTVLYIYDICIYMNGCVCVKPGRFHPGKKMFKHSIQSNTRASSGALGDRMKLAPTKTLPFPVI